MMIGKLWMEKDLKVAVVTQFEVLSQYLPRGTEENHEKT
jgi:hypothetical protein